MTFPKPLGASEETLDYWPYRTFNWGRWENDLGTLNLVDKAAVKRGLQSPQTFEVCALGSIMRPDEVLGDTNYACNFEHTLLRAGKYEFGPTEEPVFESGDRFMVEIHGMSNSHIDAFCHVGHKGLSFNGVPFEDVVSLDGGAKRYTVIDVPAQRGLDFLRPGDPVVPGDLMHLDGIIVPGDALVIRTGRFAAPLIAPDSASAEDEHGNWSGLHVDCIDLLDKWDVCTLATDGPADNFPSTTSECSVPIHVLTEVYLGLPLVHHLNLETLSERLVGRERKAFQFSVAPLCIEGGTGSPVSPLAVI
jgi:kynurenine formamidase